MFTSAVAGLGPVWYTYEKVERIWIMFKYIFIGFFVLIAIGAVWAYVVSNKVKKHGIETEAVVSRIDVQESLDSDNCVSRTETCYVSYVNQNGETVEAVLSNPKKGLKQGSRLKIKYLLEKQEYPVLIEIL